MNLSSLTNPTVLIYGDGNVGQAFKTGILYRKLTEANNIQLVGRPTTGGQAPLYTYGAVTPQTADVIAIAVKPDDCITIAQELRNKLQVQQLIISFAAFRKLDQLQKLFKHEQIVRVMPTLALEVAMSDTKWLASGPLSTDHQFILNYIFGNLGQFRRAENDDEVDKHTIIASCNIGIIAWILCRYMSSLQSGLNYNDFTEVRRAVLYNASAAIEMVSQSPNWNLNTLAEAVQTPGGITEHIISTLQKLKTDQAMLLAAQSGADFIQKYYQRQQNSCGGC